MAAVTACTSNDIMPGIGITEILVISPATMDSNDSIDVSSATVTGGKTLSSIVAAMAWDKTTGDSVTATFSGTTITVDAAGGTTDHTYILRVIGYP